MAGEKRDRPISIPPEELEDDDDLDTEQSPEPEFADIVADWDAALDSTDYFRLLGLVRDRGGPLPSDDEVRNAWRAFALMFHPDVHRDEELAVRDSATRVFQRGAEAYKVLADPVTRGRYAQLFDGQGVLRLSHEDAAQSKRESTGRAQDLVRSAGARPFAVRADELIAKGDFKQARLQLQLASMRESDNAGLEALLRFLDEELIGSRRRR